MATSIPKVTVAKYLDGFLASCGCGFLFWHKRRHVVDEQAIDHQRRGHNRKAGCS